METSESVENGNKYVKDVISFCYYLFIRGSSAVGWKVFISYETRYDYIIIMENTFFAIAEDSSFE